MENGHEVLLIDRDPHAIKSDTVPEAEWLLADACELSSLEEAGIDTCDVVIAATGDDKANLVMSLLAKTEFGVPRTVARVNHPKNEWLFNEVWGVDVAVSTPRLMWALVEEAVTRRRPGPAAHLPRGRRQPGGDDAAERAARCVGARIGDMTWPGDVVLVAHHPGRPRPAAGHRRVARGRRRTAVRHRAGLREGTGRRCCRPGIRRSPWPRPPPRGPNPSSATPGLPGSPRPPASLVALSRRGILHRRPTLGQHQSDHRQRGDQQRPAEDDLGHSEPDHLAGEEQRQLDDEPGDVRHGQHQGELRGHLDQPAVLGPARSGHRRRRRSRIRPAAAGSAR